MCSTNYESKISVKTNENVDSIEALERERETKKKLLIK